MLQPFGFRTSTIGSHNTREQLPKTMVWALLCGRIWLRGMANVEQRRALLRELGAWTMMHVRIRNVEWRGLAGRCHLTFVRYLPARGYK